MALISCATRVSWSLLIFSDLCQTLEEQITRYFHDIGDPPEETLGEFQKAPRFEYRAPPPSSTST